MARKASSFVAGGLAAVANGQLCFATLIEELRTIQILATLANNRVLCPPMDGAVIAIVVYSVEWTRFGFALCLKWDDKWDGSHGHIENRGKFVRRRHILEDAWHILRPSARWMLVIASLAGVIWQMRYGSRPWTRLVG